MSSWITLILALLTTSFALISVAFTKIDKLQKQINELKNKDMF